MPSTRSLKFRVALALLVLAMTVWIAGGVATVWITLHEAGEALDGQLAQSAKLLAALPTEEFSEYEHQIDLHQTGASATRYEPHIAFQVWDRAGKLVFSSPAAPAVPAPATESLGQALTLAANGVEWRAYAIENRRIGHKVQVMAREQLSLSLGGDVAQYFARSALIVLPLMLLIGGLVLRGALAPIERLRGDLARRAPHDLTPLGTARVPSELGGLVTDINGLMHRYDESLTSIRRFSAHAAHELRTPLAAIRMHAQVARGETDPAWRDAPLREIDSAANNMTALLDQLMALAHLDHAEIDFKREPCDLADLIRNVADGGTIQCKLPDGPLIVSGIPALIEIALGNLLRNARRHGAGVMLIEAVRSAGAVWIAVEDDGPGIAPDAAAHVFEPFYRAASAPPGGAGLGLSIVARIARVHGGSASVEPPRHLSGARVSFSIATGTG